jgi:hypothetical protein
MSLAEKIQGSNGNEIYAMTGCLSACDKDEYQIDKVAKDIIRSYSERTRLEKVVRLNFMFQTGEQFSQLVFF